MKKNNNDDNFAYINNNEDIPTDDDSDIESQISTDTRGDTESNEDNSINLFKNRVQLVWYGRGAPSKCATAS